MADADTVAKIELGSRLKQARQSRAISQRELARRAGVPNATISQIELGKASPSISSLRKILSAIPLTLAEFFTDSASRESVVVSRDELVKFARAEGVVLHMLTPPFENATMQIVYGTYEPGADIGSEMLSHGKEEGGMILKGNFEMTVGEQIYILKAGDVFYYESSKPHRFRNIGKTNGEIITVSTPPGL